MLEEIKNWIVEYGHTILEEYPVGTKNFRHGGLVLDGEEGYYTIKVNKNNTYYISKTDPDHVCCFKAPLEEAKKILEHI